jgi:hypothetical protein
MRWDAMKGDDRVRSCEACDKDVYNLSAMTRDEAESLLHEQDGSICARIHRRADGTVMTSDCPMGARQKRRRRTTAAAVGAGTLVLAAGAAALWEAEPPRMVEGSDESFHTSMTMVTMGIMSHVEQAREDEPAPSPGRLHRPRRPVPKVRMR